jgi:hypothetical protein
MKINNTYIIRHNIKHDDNNLYILIVGNVLYIPSSGSMSRSLSPKNCGIDKWIMISMGTQKMIKFTMMIIRNIDMNYTEHDYDQWRTDISRY